MSGNGYDADLYDAVGGVFGKAVDPTVLTAAETDGMSHSLWSAVSELGFPLVGVAEERGGSGGDVVDALAIAVQAGRSAVPLPVVETHLAAWLLTAAAGVDVGSGPMTVARPDARAEVSEADGRVRGTLYDVGWARTADRIVAVLPADGREVLVDLDPAVCNIVAGADLAGQPCDVVTFADAAAREVDPGTADALFLRGALLRAGQIAGALETVADITLAYAGERHQFGKPLHAFQAVQQHLVTLAQCAETSALSVARAGLAARQRPASFEISSARLVAGRSARDGVRVAHQAHGAISMTREYRVQHWTRRLATWRWEFGTEAELARRIGAAVAESPSFAAVVGSERESPEVTRV